MDDVRAVMDAAGSERAVLLGVSEGAPLSMVFAATHPERTAGLIFVGGEVKEIREDDWPWGASTREEYEGMLDGILERRDRVGKGHARLVRAEQGARPGGGRLAVAAPAVIRVPRGCGCLHAARKRDRRSLRGAVDPRADARPPHARGSGRPLRTGHAGWPSRSREPASSSWRARTTCPGSTSPTRSSPRYGIS